MPHMPFITELTNSDRQTCTFYCTCLALGAILAIILSFNTLRRLWIVLKYQHTMRARVVEKQRCPRSDMSEEVGNLSFGNGVLDEYTLWLEIMDKSLVRQLGIQSVCGMNGFEYREQWDKIPKHAEAHLCLEKNQTEDGNIEWTPKWVELNCKPSTGEFIIYDD